MALRRNVKLKILLITRNGYARVDNEDDDDVVENNVNCKLLCARV